MPRAFIGRPPTTAEIVGAVLVVTAAFVAATGWIAWHRGIWYDEVWSLYYAHHDVGFRHALVDRWLTDNHPPAFYALSWLAYPLVGDDLFARRMLNVIPLVAAFAAIAWLAWSDSRVRHFAVVLALLLLGTTHMFDAMIEHRGYMTQLAADAVLVTGLFAVTIRSDDYAAGDFRLLLLLGLALLVAFNLHYFSAFITGAIVAVFIASWWLQRKRRWAIRLMAVAILAGLPLVAAYLVERSVLESTATNFWVTTTTGAGVQNIMQLIGSARYLNVVVLGAVAWGLYGKEFRQDGGAQTAAFALTAAAAILVTATALLLANAVRPFIVPRYLVAMAPFSAAILAAMSAEVILRYRWVTALAIVASIMAMTSAFGKQAGVMQWTTTAGPVAEIARHCPSTVVHALPRWIIRDNPQVLANEDAVVRFGYAHVAAQSGFAIEDGNRVSRDCPTLLWMEQHNPIPAADAARWANLPVTPDQIAHARVIEGETGFVVDYPAPQLSSGPAGRAPNQARRS